MKDNRSVSSRCARLAIWLIAGFVILGAAVAQEGLLLQLGDRMSYARMQAQPLVRTVTRSPRFFRAVGGVAFEAIAQGEQGVRAVGLKYDGSRPDGGRLRVTVVDASGDYSDVGTDLYDWELVPIARFANSDSGSAVTLFGNLSDANVEQQILEGDNRIINYHPTLDNTLLGLRLLQADLLIFQENATDLFKSGGAYILGAGEVPPDVAKNLERFRKIEELRDRESRRGGGFESYVLGDLGQKVTYRVVDEALQFSGKPYWWAWSTPDSVQEKLDLEVLQITFRGLAEGKTEQQVKREIERTIRDTLAEAPVQYEKELSRIITSGVENLDGVNPTVYRALVRTMRYRALFREIKRNDAEAFAAFLADITGVPVLPKVTTPTVQYGSLQ